MALDERITVKVDGVDREIFMSMGLLRAMQRNIGHAANFELIAHIMVDQELRDKFLAELLHERKEGSGKVVKEVDLDDVNLSIADQNKLLLWASEHLLDFFTQTMMAFGELTEMVEAKRKETEKTSSDQPLTGSQA